MAMRNLLRAIGRVPAGWRWSLWSVYAIAWTLALELPNPVHAREGEEQLREGLFLFSKSVHLSAYALFAALTGWLVVRRRTRWLLAAALSLHAIGTEVLQHVLDVGRTGSVRDVLLDHAGIVVGMLLTWGWWFAPQPGKPVSAPDGPRADAAATPADPPPLPAR